MLIAVGGEMLLFTIIGSYSSFKGIRCCFQGGLHKKTYGSDHGNHGIPGTAVQGSPLGVTAVLSSC